MQTILLASHGTQGARAAEAVALARLGVGDQLYHLQVVPDFWDGMQGDDWLNNASTRDVFAEYVENSLSSEARENFSRVADAARRCGASYESRLVYGKPPAALLEAVSDVGPDCVVMGAPRPKNVAGFRSRMVTDSLLRGIAVPVLVVPFPNG